MKKIWLSSPHLGSSEFEFVKEAFKTNWIAPLGPNVDGFEKDLSEFLGSGHVAALSSGTAALHLSLILLGVKRDDYVLCQSMTFSASANPIVYQQAIPVFIDSELETWNMDPFQLRRGIEFCLTKGKLPKAIIVVHLYGMPAKMNEILNIASEFGIPVIEDAAEAVGSTYNGKNCGVLTKLGVLSFNGNKIITTSGGGALVSDDEKLINMTRFLATQARDAAPHYEHSSIGYNYRMSNVCAGIGRGQMLVLPERILQRRANFKIYHEAFIDQEGIKFQPEASESKSNRWLTCITVDEHITGGIGRENLRLALERNMIESRPLWKPMHLQPIFKDYPNFLNGNSEKLFTDGLCLPSGSNLTEDDLERIIGIVRDELKSNS